MKKFTAMLMILALCLFAPSAFSEGPDCETVETETESCVNPLYDGMLDIPEPAAHFPDAPSAAGTGDASTYSAGSYDEAVSMLRQQLVERKTELSVVFRSEGDFFDGDYTNLAKRMITAAMAHTGNPVEGDYIRWQYGKWNGSKSVTRTTDGTDIYTYSFTYTITWFADAAQERDTDDACRAILDGLCLDGLTDYEKIRGIYGWICDNVVYDYENSSDSTNTLCHTAYSAAVQHITVCQGYSLLFYRLCLTEGIDSRLIAGRGNSQNHGWNIVLYDGRYYDVDSTWDAGKTAYRCFMKPDADFSGHSRFDEYLTAEFLSDYPMASAGLGHPVFFDIPTEYASCTVAYVDDNPCPMRVSGGRAAVFTDSTAASRLSLCLNDCAEDISPRGMLFRFLTYDSSAEGFYAMYDTTLDDILQYRCCSIPTSDEYSLRIICAISTGLKQALNAGKCLGYSLKEYGTLAAWQADAGEGLITLDTPHASASASYRRDEMDAVYISGSSLTAFSCVIPIENRLLLKEKLLIRPYAVLENENGDTVTVYGSQVARSAGDIALQNIATFLPGTEGYIRVHDILRAVWGSRYDPPASAA